MKNIIKTSFFFIITLLILQSCENSSDSSSKTDILKVKFVNNEASAFAISYIQLQAMGKAGEVNSTPIGDWSENIIPADTRIESGSTMLFDLEIPNLHWSRYRIGVIDSTGNEVILHEQDGYEQSFDLPIQHWGSHDRTSGVTVVKDPYTGLINVIGWIDGIGLDD